MGEILNCIILASFLVTFSVMCGFSLMGIVKMIRQKA